MNHESRVTIRSFEQLGVGQQVEGGQAPLRRPSCATDHAGIEGATRSLDGAELARAGMHDGQRPSVTAVFAMPRPMNSRR